MAGTAVRASGRVGHEPKDKNFLSQLKHRARHDRLTSLPVSDVLSFARISCHCLFFFAQRAGHRSLRQRASQWNARTERNYKGEINQLRVEW
jgi:hypothetical protein